MMTTARRFAAKTVTEVADGFRNGIDLIANVPLWLLGIWAVVLVSTLVGAAG